MSYEKDHSKKHLYSKNVKILKRGKNGRCTEAIVRLNGQKWHILGLRCKKKTKQKKDKTTNDDS